MLTYVLRHKQLCETALEKNLLKLLVCPQSVFLERGRARQHLPGLCPLLTVADLPQLLLAEYPPPPHSKPWGTELMSEPCSPSAGLSPGKDSSRGWWDPARPQRAHQWGLGPGGQKWVPGDSPMNLTAASRTVA